MMSIFYAWYRSITDWYRKIWYKPTSDELYRSVVRLYRTGGTVLVGGGFFIHTSHVLTCAHVVNLALQSDDHAREMLQEMVSLRYADNQEICQAQVVLWRPENLDIAVLELRDRPGNKHPLQVRPITDLSNHRFKVAGFPPRHDYGVITYGRISGRRIDGLVQLEVDHDARYWIEPGFSGMPVWSETAQTVIGMIVEADRDPAKKVGFMMPMSRLMSIPVLRELIDGKHVNISSPPQPQGFSVHPEAFLEYFTHNATAERERLSAFFVEPAIFSTLKQPVSHIVYGAGGYGKTAVCLMLKATLQTRGDCLVIHFDHFECFPKNEVTLDTWSDCIQRQLLHILLDGMRTSEPRKSRFLRSDQAASRANFWAACKLSKIQQDIIELPDNHKNILRTYRDSRPIDKFEILGQIAKDSGFTNIYVLLDGLNNYTEEYNDGITLIRPLLSDLDPLQQRGFSFKFFLPGELRQRIQQGIGISRSLTTRELAWEPEQLRKMLGNRLQNIPNPSRPNTRLGTVQCFADLCVPDLEFEVDQKLVEAAHGSPRRLMQLACAVIERHCQHDKSADRIRGSTITAVLAEMDHDN